MKYSVSLAHVNDRIGLIVMASIFTIIIIMAVVLRFYSRRLSRARLGPEDWLALSALVFVLALNGIFIAGTAQGAITGHSPVVDGWPVTTELEHLVQKYKFAFQTTEKIAFGLVKLSLLFLWKRIFSRARRFVLLCWVMIGVIAAWSIAFFFSTLFQCGTDWQKNWAPIGIFLTQCLNSLDLLTVFTATDILTDFIIILMPVPMIWKLQMQTKRKVGITATFMVGFFTIGAGIARSYVYLVTSYDKEDNLDFIADFTIFILWSEIEVNIAMLVCCMPVLAPSLHKMRECASHLLPRRLQPNWMLLSPEKAASGTSFSKSSKPYSRDSVPLESVTRASETPSWLGASGSVAIVAEHDDVEGRPENFGVILAQTEIKSTSESLGPGYTFRGV
ncbi:hypothetical protein F5Y14DRAFT_461024 [Nemania sp. NC0429]|nr:hypothetical protein F5Y14DRAFT_461024 [Nemania sp. NC0429]